MAADFPPPLPHGEITPLADDVFWVEGSIRVAPGVAFNRNMVVVREQGALTLLNAVRMDEAGEAALEALGQVRHVVRLGYYHGRDDAYCVERFSAAFWRQDGPTNSPDPAPPRLLAESGALPLADAELFTFRAARFPESALLLRGPKLLITCDSLQDHSGGRFLTLFASLTMRMMGFKRRLLVGPMWKKVMTPEGGSLASDFQRLRELDFTRLIGAHGVPCEADVKAKLDRALATAFSG